MTQRLIKEESGMTMGLVVIMLVLIGVMGAGLLTFVQRDLGAVVEVNQGQRAFEMADAGVKAAKLQINANRDPRLYDGGIAGGVADSPWYGVDGAASGGTTLNMDGNTVNVRIQDVSTGGTVSYRVISDGRAGQSRRKIEAIFRQSAGNGASGIPAYYTPGDIKIKPNTTIKTLSMFTEQNIKFENLAATTRAAFRQDYLDSGGLFKVINATTDPLGDWNVPNWNNVSRTGSPGYPSPWDNDTGSVQQLGFAAEGKICGSSSCGTSDPSVADGVYGYDSTTGNRGNNLKFAKKIDCATTLEVPQRNLNVAGAANNNGPTCTPPTPARDILTYPFRRDPWNAERLRQIAQTQSYGNKYFAGSSVPWSTFYNNASGDDQVVFIDAQGSTIDFSSDGSGNEANNKGILVIWCGQLVMNKKFQGIVITLYGNDLPGGSSCANDKGTYRSAGVDVTGYVYAEGGTADGSQVGIELDTNSTVTPLPSPGNLFNVVFGGPTMVQLQSWRELYQ